MGTVRHAFWLAALVAIGCSSGDVSENETRVWTLSGPTMGTRYAVSLVGGDEAAAQSLKAKIDLRLAELNRRMSTYDPGSELSRFNASREAGGWFAVSGETATVVAYAVAVADQSGGAFDPTIGPVVNLWGFGPGDAVDRPPEAARIDAALAAVGYGGIETRVGPPALRKASGEAYVDLSAVAKGYGVDAVCEVVAAAGYTSFMVEIGGEVRAAGRKPNGASWRIGVERADEPLRFEGGRRLQEVVPLSDRALATSGDYRNFFEHDGVRYSHTIDPRTGRPVTHALATVSVLAETCMEADAIATALLVLGPTEGYDWAVERGVAALLVERSAEGQLRERATPAWSAALENPSPAETAP
ncbi:MAG: FAD:protein FMN transferase [Planctomycetota bacterium]